MYLIVQLSALLPVSQYTRNMTTEAPKAVAEAGGKLYTIDVVTVDDTEEVLEFLKTFFFKVCKI